MKNMWVIRAGKDTRNFNLYKEENFVSVGVDIGDINNLTLDEIKLRLNNKTKNVEFLAGVIRRFRDEVQIGDYFVCTSPHSLYFLLGEIIGDVNYNPDLSQRYRYTCYRRPVKWISKIYRNDLSEEAKRALSPQITVFKVNPKWQDEIFKNQIDLDFIPKNNENTNLSHHLNKEEYITQDDDYLEIKFNLKKKGLRLENRDLDEAISFYKKLINNDLFIDDYYPFKRLTVMYHKKKDYQSEAEIIRDFFKSNVLCNKYQFYSFKYKLKKLVNKSTFSISDFEKLTTDYLENIFDFNAYENLKIIPAERIIKDKNNIKVISDDEMKKRYKKHFLEAIADGLYRDKNNQEAFEVYIDMIYVHGYYNYRYYQRLCSIYRRTKNYEQELMVIREYFEEYSLKKTKHSDKWFKDRLESTKKLINNESMVDSILNSKYQKEAHLQTDIELNDLDSDFKIESNKDFEIINHSPTNHYVEEKYKLKSKALNLEKDNIDSAIHTYKEYLSHDLFANDYYSYRRLVLLYEKKKNFESEYNIIKLFFISGIYCNNHQFLWFRNKLRRLIDKGYTTEKEITELEEFFKNNGLNNKDLSNTPVEIADRIRFKNGSIYILSEEEYDKTERTWELEEIASEYKRQKNYDCAIKIYEQINSILFLPYKK